MKLFKVIFIFLFSLLLGSNYAQWNDGTPVSSGNGLDATPSEFLNNGYAVKCDGGSDGEIKATVSSGTGPYYYDWVGIGIEGQGPSFSTISGQSAGTYQVTIYDLGNIISGDFDEITLTISISSPPALGFKSSGFGVSQTNPSCFYTTDGAISSKAQGGIAGTYGYLWDDPGATASRTISGIGHGTYTVTVTDGNLCTASRIYTIDQPTEITTISTKVQDVQCNGDADGSISVTASGGTPGYTYLWDDASAQTTSTATGLAPGDYTVTVTDATGCTVTTTPAVTITEPVVLTASATKVQDVTCNGDADGSISVTESGGTPGYTYLWDDASAQTTSTAIGLAPGDYTVTVTDANGCTFTTTPAVTITEPTAITAIATKLQDVSCNGDADGSISVTESGGTPGYTYLWDDASAQTTSTAIGLAPGDYTVTVTDANGCTFTTTPAVTITEPVVLTASATKVQDVQCNGDADGSISVTASGGTAGYTYLWDDASAQTTSTATGLAPGDYTVTVTDANGCTFTTTPAVTITEPVVLTASATKVQDVQCNGDADGSISVTASGGTPGYTYLWDDASAQTTSTAIGLAPGDYTVTVTDASGCTFTTTPAVTITEPVVLTASATKVQDVQCNGDADGSISVTASGGTPGYTYLWDDASAQTTSTATGLAPGDYTVTVTDANGCTFTTTPAVTITEPVVLTASATKVQDVQCNGDADGSISVTASGGTPGYTYLWDDASAQTTSTATGLAPGDYTVTVTDATGCTVTTTPAVTITEPVVLTASATKVQDVTCNGDADGSISVTESGGTPGYTYLWDDASAQTTSTAIGLAPGDYTVTVTDANGCTFTTTPAVTITEPTAITAIATKLQDVSCNGDADGSISVTESGGTPGYTYLWDDASAQTTSTAIGLAPGDYTVTVTDANGCTFTTTPAVTITEPAALAQTNVSVDVSCNGGTDGQIVVTASNGTAPYQVSWTGTATGDPAGDEISLDGEDYTIGSLDNGNYTVVITDANNCQISFTKTIFEPTALTATISSSTTISCNGGSDGTATVDVAGGTLPYDYAWSNGQTLSGDVSGTNTATGLAQGNISITITDGKGCTATDNTNITEPTVLTATATKVQDVTCNGDADGSITVVGTGGTAAVDYSYLWSDGQTTATATGLAPGSYTVILTDDNGCTFTTTPAVTITEPTVLTATATKVQDVTCNGDADGSITVVGTGGTAAVDYSYLWSDGQTTATATGLAPGSYTVILTDDNGCTFTTTPAVTITEPTVLTATATKVQDVTCNGDADGSITVVGTGGTAAVDYSYLWSDGQTTATATGLAPGSYTVILTDDNGCTFTTTPAVTITEPTVLTATATKVQDVTCNGDADGSITVVGTGGTAAVDYSYLWSDGQTTATATGLAPGSYTVILTDDNGCTFTTTPAVTITEPTVLTATATKVQDVTCNGDADGSITVVGTGGTAAVDYSYLWSDGQTTATATGLAPGSYTVILTDDNGCTFTTTPAVTITEPTVLTATATKVQDVTCNGDADGSITVVGTGGTAAVDYSYLWSDGQTTATATGLAPGSYTVILTDDNGCTFTTTPAVTITEPTVLTATATKVQDVTCNGDADGSITVVGTGGTAAVDYSYLWSDGQTTATATGLAPGSYTVILTDDNGCTFTTTPAVTITEPTVLTATATKVQDVTCNGDADGSITVVGTGGTAAVDYSYLWSDGQTTATATGLAPGSYTVILTDDNGCTFTTTPAVTITEPTVLTATATKVQDVTCNGDADGSITVVGTGGTAAVDYSYLWSDGQTTATATGLAPGSYTVILTDDNGCTFTTTPAVTITEPNALVANLLDTDSVVCNGGSNGAATIDASGGTAGYDVSWTGLTVSGTTYSDNPVGIEIINDGDTYTINSFPSGTYDITVTDQNGCNVTINTVVIEEPPVMTVSTIAHPVIADYQYMGVNEDKQTFCYFHDGTLSWDAGRAKCQANGGDYIMIKSQAEQTAYNAIFGGLSDSRGWIGLSQNESSPLYTPIFSPGTPGNPDEATSGWEWIDGTQLIYDPATDTWNGFQSWGGGEPNDWKFGAAGAVGEEQWAQFWSQPNPGEFSWNDHRDAQKFYMEIPIGNTINGNHVSCFGGNDGKVAVTAVGGETPYTYSWNTIPVQTTDTAFNLSAGEYIVIVTDDLGCEAGDTVIITQPLPYDISSSQDSVNCYNGNDGTGSVVVSGGTPNYTYLWDDATAQTTATAINLSAGTYNVIISDSKSCDSTFTIEVLEPAIYDITTSQDSTTCNGDSDGWAEAIVNSGGTGTYTYLWDAAAGNQTTSRAINLSAGIYSVTISDSYLCDTILNIEVLQPDPVIASFNPTPVTCFGGNDGELLITAIGGTNSYNISWAGTAVW